VDEVDAPASKRARRSARPCRRGCARGRAQIMQDVSEEHARKTITVDPFPHTAVRSASIDPCKHAAVMQKLGALAETGGKPFRVERRGARAALLLSCSVPAHVLQLCRPLCMHLDADALHSREPHVFILFYFILGLKRYNQSWS